MKFKPGYFLLCLFLLPALFSNGQLYKISGTVRDNRNEPLPLANVEVKELRRGAVTKDDGTYQFFLERGKYDLVVSMIGYKTKIVTVFITNDDITENMSMENDEGASLGEVILKVKARDRAEELIRNVVRHKESILDAIGSHSYTAYIKAFQLDSGFVKKKKDDEGYSEIKDDFGSMALTEVSLRLDKLCVSLCYYVPMWFKEN